MNLNDRISEIIKYSEFTSSEFADEIDVQRSSVSHITSGRNKPSLEFITKIKNRFPEISWDWLIIGEGEMLEGNKPDVNMIKDIESPKTASLPDLFSLIDDESFGKPEIDKNENAVQALESNTAGQNADLQQISDSQRLVGKEENTTSENTVNQKENIKRIVIFYESGKFESFQQ